PSTKTRVVVTWSVSVLIVATLVQRMTLGQSTADDLQRLHKPASQGESSRYYYQRGERVIWRDDFTKYKAGAFPQRMELLSGHFEVKNVNGRNYFWTVAGAVLNLNLPEALPQRFSIEIEYDSPHALSPFLFVTQVDRSSPPRVFWDRSTTSRFSNAMGT